MTDNIDNTTVEQTTQQQVSSQPQATTATVDWEARYKGSVRKVEELTLTNRNLLAQLEDKNSELEQLKTQLGIAGTEKDVAVGERDKQIKQLTEAKLASEAELNSLRSLKVKLDVIREMNAPELATIIDKIPNVEDPEVLREVMKSFTDWRNNAVKERESQLLAGETPGSPSVIVSEVAPQTEDDWRLYVNDAPLGSAERAKRFDQWREWGMSLEQ